MPRREARVRQPVDLTAQVPTHPEGVVNDYDSRPRPLTGGPSHVGRQAGGGCRDGHVCHAGPRSVLAHVPVLDRGAPAYRPVRGNGRDAQARAWGASILGPPAAILAERNGLAAPVRPALARPASAHGAWDGGPRSQRAPTCSGRASDWRGQGGPGGRGTSSGQATHPSRSPTAIEVQPAATGWSSRAIPSAHASISGQSRKSPSERASRAAGRCDTRRSASPIGLRSRA